ncbi:MAG: OmpA family protein [Bacteroidales bacterium]|nr:OmpA family protein [Bacteroidales bacterium]
MKQILITLLMLFAIGGTTEIYAQSWLNNVGNKVKERVKEKTEDKVLEQVDKAVDQAFDETEDAVKGENKKSNDKNDNVVDNEDEQDNDTTTQTTGAPQKGQSLEMTYAKSDFVPGDEIIFDDPMDNEQMGEFPSQWDLLRGSAEVASVNGKKCINLEAGTEATIAPLMKDMNNYLPDVFTIELDYWVNADEDDAPNQNYHLMLNDASGTEVMYLEFGEDAVRASYIAPSGETRSTDVNWKEKTNDWSHLSISFNKRAFKAYINGTRVVNIPNMKAPASMNISNTHWSDHRTMITNIRIAKGAVPLYDRMMSDGKFITYGITFDVGKSTIKPESMGEINRIVQLMSENTDLKFSVEGHTDATGNVASNQTLSEARSKAIVDKLVELGVSADRLTSVGKGQSSPIADNGTDEGRAKNRRVEFVKQ